ncbi:MAG: ACP phosphodiesterase [Rhodanobacteraceae bacterium]
MNLLAHALLAAPDADLMFGGLIGDFVRGRVDPHLPAGVRAGIAMHRAIDGYTDRHADVTQARALVEPPLRRYAGVLLDIWFDHLLARNWSAYSREPLDVFSRHVRDLLDERAPLVPERMRGFVAYLHANDLPAAYRDLEMIDRVLHGVSARFRRANPVATALPALLELEAPLRACFDAFFPQLIAFAANERAGFAPPQM